MSPRGLEQPDLFAPELGTVAELDFVYTLASTNIYPFPHEKILDQTKFKAFAEDK